MSVSTITGIHQGPFGSLVRERDGINDSDRDALYAPPGQRALRRALADYRDAGANIGGAPTYRLTHLRPQGNAADQWNYQSDTILRLDDKHVSWNTAAVRIAKSVYGDRRKVFGLLAPVADTSGAHDPQWENLGQKQKAYALQRHRPQLETLLAAGIEDFLVEAGRYVSEAEALAAFLAREGAKTLAFSFEAPQGVVPDPAHRDLSFANVADRLHQAAAGKGELETAVGINCVDPSAIRIAIDRNDLPKIVYPNKPRDRDPSPEEYRKLFRDCLAAGAEMISVCCGGTPDHIRLAREEYDKHQSR